MKHKELSFLCSNNEACTASTSTPRSNLGKSPIRLTPCSEVVNLDNHHKDEKSDYPDRVISSRMIVEEYGGIAKILASLYTNGKVSEA